ncbi:MAG: MFS transporter [Gordonia paraffinivorans]
MTSTREARVVLVVAALGTLLVLVAFTTPLSTLTATASSLGADVAGRTWILSSMSIGLGAALLSAGTIADDVGRRRTFAVGLVVMAVGSVVGVLVGDVTVFVLSRVVVGIGGAAVIAASLGMIAHAFAPGPSRAAASGVWGASVGAGIAVGPLLSALLERADSWHDAYWVLAALCLTLAVVAERAVPESRSDQRRGLDLVGAPVFAAAVAALLAGLVEGRQGWTAPIVIVLFVAAVLLAALFVIVERRSRSAMIDLELLRSPAFVAATVAAVAVGAGAVALMSYMPGFVVTALDLDPTGAAVLLLAWSATSVVTALLARRLPAGWSGRAQLAVGLIGVGVGLALLTGLDAGSRWVHLVPGLVVAGVATGVVNAALGREAVASVPAGRGGMGSGANNTARYVGSAVGVTIVAVVAARPGAGSAATALTHGWNVAAVVTAAISVAGGLAVAALHTRTRTASPTPADAPAASGGPRPS